MNEKRNKEEGDVAGPSMVEKTLHCRQKRVHSQRQTYLGESRADTTRLS